MIKKRTERVELTLSKDEKRLIEKTAAEHGMTVSAFIRWALVTTIKGLVRK